MAYASTTIVVEAPLEAVWRILLDKVEHPGGSGVESCDILESTGSVVVRRVTTRTSSVTERVSIDEIGHEIRFTLLDHRHLLGYVLNRVARVPGRADATELTLTIDMMPKDPTAPDDHDLSPVLGAAAEEIQELSERSQRR